MVELLNHRIQLGSEAIVCKARQNLLFQFQNLHAKSFINVLLYSSCLIISFLSNSLSSTSRIVLFHGKHEMLLSEYVKSSWSRTTSVRTLHYSLWKISKVYYLLPPESNQANCNGDILQSLPCRSRSLMPASLAWRRTLSLSWGILTSAGVTSVMSTSLLNLGFTTLYIFHMTY